MTTETSAAQYAQRQILFLCGKYTCSAKNYNKDDLWKFSCISFSCTAIFKNKILQNIARGTTDPCYSKSFLFVLFCCVAIHKLVSKSCLCCNFLKDFVLVYCRAGKGNAAELSKVVFVVILCRTCAFCCTGRGIAAEHLARHTFLISM